MKRASLQDTSGMKRNLDLAIKVMKLGEIEIKSNKSIWSGRNAERNSEFVVAVLQVSENWLKVSLIKYLYVNLTGL